MTVFSKFVKSKLFFIFLAVILFLNGCAQTHSVGRKNSAYSPGSYTTIDKFCRSQGFVYKYDTIDDLIVLSSENDDIRLLLDSDVAYRNGSIFYLKNPAVYQKGQILLPNGLKDILSANDFSFFKPTFEIKTIVLDAGHGGKDPGAVSIRGLQEKYVNLKVVLILKQELEKRGFTVFLTRGTDTFITLAQRAEFARLKKADLFVSIHANANRSRQVKGVEVYHLTPDKFRPKSRSLDLAKTSDFSGVPYEAKVGLWQMLLTKDYDLSIELSNSIYHSFQRRGFSVKLPRKAPFYVLRYAYVPAVLVEMGYLSNPYEEKVLRKNYYQKQIAEAIALGIVELQKKYSAK
ncbi:MAG: N-acetylmuramoyl-L-alanine amidase [Candidatus Omnitrophica bacterium]|nr:N-acetylmuramoyl-L-alanine amidase [Candidatus Omnitrophota bacterium]